MLTLTDISRSYGRKRVLDGVSATFPTGLTLLVGPSGAGKSTLLRLLATAEKPNAGTIAWDGVALPRARKAVRATLGYAPQAVDLPEDLTAREFALHMAALKGLEARAADAQFGAITERIGLHADINNRIATFSGGMRRRLVFAQAMLGAPRLLALDEPTAELDGETAAQVSALIVERAREAVVVMTTHLADALAPRAVQVLRVDQGPGRTAMMLAEPSLAQPAAQPGAVLRSSFVTSLTRYRRSWGLWLLLLIAPVGARFMISDESGRGVAIAVADQLPVLTSAMLGVWLGIVVTTLLLPVGYIYLRANTNRRQPWQVEEVTAAPRIAMLLGRFAADAAVLLGTLSTLTLAGWFLGWLMVSGPYSPWQIAYPLWLIAAPPLIALAALRILFDAVPWLRGALGDLAYFVLWMASIVMPIVAADQPSSFTANLFDHPGFVRPLAGSEPAGEMNVQIGGVDPARLKPGRIDLDVRAGLNAPGYVAARFAWIGIAVVLVLVAGLIYRPHRSGRKQAGQGRIARLLSAGPPPVARADAPPAPPARSALPGLGLAEFRLIGAGRLFLLLAAGAAFAGLSGDYRHVGSPAALLLLVFALSAQAGRCEARGLLKLTATTATPPMLRRAAFVTAGLAWSLLLALPAAIVRGSGEPLLLALTTGAAASATAMALAALTGSSFAPRVVLLIAWYVYLSS